MSLFGHQYAVLIKNKLLSTLLDNHTTPLKL